MPDYTFVDRSGNREVTIKCNMRDIEWVTEKVAPHLVRVFTSPAMQPVPGLSEAMEWSVGLEQEEARQRAKDRQEGIEDIHRALVEEGVYS